MSEVSSSALGHWKGADGLHMALLRHQDRVVGLNEVALAIVIEGGKFLKGPVDVDVPKRGFGDAGVFDRLGNLPDPAQRLREATIEGSRS